VRRVQCEHLRRSDFDPTKEEIFGMPKRTCVLLASVVSSLSLLGLPAVAAADGWVEFNGSPASMGPGASFSTGYDCNANLHWDNIYFTKSHVAKGTIAWIDTGGTWKYSVVDSYETVMSYNIYPDIDWVKKLYAKNTSSITYDGDAQGYLRSDGSYCT
jgi:hypothetical protein